MPGHFCAQSGNEPVQLHCLFLRHPKHISLRLPEDEHVLQRSVLPLVRQRERLTQPVRDFHEDTVADILKILPIQAERRVQIPFRGVGNDDLTEDFPTAYDRYSDKHPSRGRSAAPVERMMVRSQ